ncbi:hypothetical protein Patl1_33411 [Pistacia atlantica]|uniref:Uncharacterized protein n=1 Tax=Pistacia atlantica TaxID=434234 RepID=A0ACC0ZTF5_9ROSI|nr:hypothetical protein Patl1_33411 [Pistacia atlantica]
MVELGIGISLGQNREMNGGEEVITATPPQPLEWKFSQVFGERTAGEEVQEVDIISAIEFDKSGDHLATGDRGGRVVLFERTDNKDFDYLKSLEIEEKINKIRWCQTANGALFLLSTNDKTIKFWKVQEKKVKKISDMNLDPLKAVANGSVASSSNASSPKPISCKCDGETFISADDLRINLWNLEISNQSFNIVDVKPANMEDLTEVITSAEFHPTHCNTLAYSSSKGSIRLIDLRQSALCDSHAKL